MVGFQGAARNGPLVVLGHAGGGRGQIRRQPRSDHTDWELGVAPDPKITLLAGVLMGTNQPGGQLPLKKNKTGLVGDKVKLTAQSSGGESNRDHQIPIGNGVRAWPETNVDALAWQARQLEVA